FSKPQNHSSSPPPSFPLHFAARTSSCSGVCQGALVVWILPCFQGECWLSPNPSPLTAFERRNPRALACPASSDRPSPHRVPRGELPRRGESGTKDPESELQPSEPLRLRSQSTADRLAIQLPKAQAL